MREAGDVCFADVQRDGEGVVEFLRREDMEYALRRLDGTEFRSHQVMESSLASLPANVTHFHFAGTSLASLKPLNILPSH